jgi:hypothetical protein
MNQPLALEHGHFEQVAFQQLEPKEVNMRRQSYLRRAKRRFLDGTRHRIPVEAVTAGVRTLEAWATILDEEREIERTRLQALSGSGDHCGRRRNTGSRRQSI